MFLLLFETYLLTISLPVPPSSPYLGPAFCLEQPGFMDSQNNLDSQAAKDTLALYRAWCDIYMLQEVQLIMFQDNRALHQESA